jgi:hypothetical protein
MTCNDFSYQLYEKIIHKYRESIVDFTEMLGPIVENRKLICIRHDVEFSIRRALYLAELEKSLGIKTTYLFQTNCNAYNIFSKENSKLIQYIQEMGFSIGLHLYISDINENDWDALYKSLEIQVNLIEHILNKKCDRFSFHRPPAWVLKNRNDYISGLLNLYGNSFFEYSENPKLIKYISDSRHKFTHGHPFDRFSFNKIQFLFHPDEWSKEGISNSTLNFQSLIEENSLQFKETLISETTHFTKK